MLNLFYILSTHKPINLSLYPHIIPVFSVFRFYCIAHVHGLSTGKLRAGFQFQIFRSCPLAHIRRTGGYSACPLWRFTETFGRIFLFFQNGILRTTELRSRKSAVVITLSAYAPSVWNDSRCPGRISFYGFKPVSVNRCHNPGMGKRTVSPEIVLKKESFLSSPLLCISFSPICHAAFPIPRLQPDKPEMQPKLLYI